MKVSSRRVIFLVVFILLVCIVVTYYTKESYRYRQTAYYTSKDQLDPNKYYVKGTLATSSTTIAPSGSIVPTTNTDTCPNYPQTIYVPLDIGKSRDKPAQSPQQLASYGYANGYYWYVSGEMTEPVYMYTVFSGGPDNRPWALAFNSDFVNYPIKPITVSDDDNLPIFNNTSSVVNLINGTTQGYTRWQPVSSSKPGDYEYKLTFVFTLSDSFNAVKLYLDKDSNTNPTLAKLIQPDTGAVLATQTILLDDAEVTIILPSIYTLSSIQLRLTRYGRLDMTLRQVEFYYRELADNKINMNIPVDGVLVQDSTGKYVSYGYLVNDNVKFNTTESNNLTPALSLTPLVRSSVEPTTLLIGGNREGYVVLFGKEGGHGIYNRSSVTNQLCKINFDDGSIGSGAILDVDGNVKCGTFPYDLYYGVGTNKQFFTSKDRNKNLPSFTVLPNKWNLWVTWDKREMTGTSKTIPAKSPDEISSLGYPDGFYWYQPVGSTSPVRLFTRFNMIDNKAWCLGVSIQTPNIVLENNLNLNIPFKGILFQNVRFVDRGDGTYLPGVTNVAYSYFSTAQPFNKRVDLNTTTSGGNRSGFVVNLGGSATHGFYRKTSVVCSSLNSDLASFGPSPNLWVWKGNHPTTSLETVLSSYLWQTWIWWN